MLVTTSSIVRNSGCVQAARYLFSKGKVKSNGTF